MNINMQLKELVDNMCEALDNLTANTELPEGVGNAARMELGMFMMYLSASDGTINWDEAHIISDICNLNLNPANIGDFIKQNNIYSTEFEQKVPVTFQITVAADNSLYDAGRGDLSASSA